MTPTTPTEPTPLIDLLLAVTALRDELDRTLERADALHDQSELLARVLLSGHLPTLPPLHAQLRGAAESLEHARAWLAAAERHAAQLRADPTPPALPAPLVEGLLALIDGLALLAPWPHADPTAAAPLAATRACVEQLLAAALRGDPLRPALLALAELQAHLLALDAAQAGPPGAAARRLGEAVEELLRG